MHKKTRNRILGNLAAIDKKRLGGVKSNGNLFRRGMGEIVRIFGINYSWGARWMLVRWAAWRAARTTPGNVSVT